MTDILVIGATGFRGRFITRYLANHPQRTSFMLGIAARSPSKLDALKQSLALDERVLTVHVDVTQPAQVWRRS
ncbi:hypothetical protein AcW1_003403 [Taiwanofungus camphoratus]|nr:hypothetical protein AcV5_002133 [Antrodia cinnamomea]KAI0919149.1 hypothetical protein AcV5_002140 [Antrodia cinnamomea]KAI0941518.1 hypothetical protein AcW1_003391 [Antrodia cinnamomea]KAI0941530.1 hypothetical protein AcW1_003403 [Antrodia cinnamomea]KAI0943970.1 hypothetical protein AcV7_001912 [Antrodia cinnamomea]